MKRSLNIRLHEALKRKDAAMLRAWKLLHTIDVWGNTGLGAVVSEARVILRLEMGPDAIAETIKTENKDGDDE